LVFSSTNFGIDFDTTMDVGVELQLSHWPNVTSDHLWRARRHSWVIIGLINIHSSFHFLKLIPLTICSSVSSGQKVRSTAWTNNGKRATGPQLCLRLLFERFRQNTSIKMIKSC
jgi:hypothetical protein